MWWIPTFSVRDSVLRYGMNPLWVKLRFKNIVILVTVRLNIRAHTLALKGKLYE